MAFQTDKQTLDDLNIIGKRGGNSIFTMFNHTATRGGAEMLEAVFLNPLNDPDAIRYRIAMLGFFQAAPFSFPFHGSELDAIEQYMAETDERYRLPDEPFGLKRKLYTFIAGDTRHRNIKAGVSATLGLIKDLLAMISDEATVALPEVLKSELGKILSPLDRSVSGPLRAGLLRSSLSFEEISDADQFLRFEFRKEIDNLLQWVYRLDVFRSVARVATEQRFVLPVLLSADQNNLLLEGVFHPQVPDPVSNKLSVGPEGSVVFLTGANMAGKSTFMKSIGIALYLAHLGFPVPALKMEFALRDGIYTTINLPDDLSSGNSHFYAEVLRVKKIAKEIAAGRNLFVIFDELFRGTNVRDACEGTVALTAAFARRPNCAFILSTHIIEAGEILKERCSNINFVYLPTVMDGSRPVYTYKLESGITSDRHGMVIINNERILEILGKAKTKAEQP
ncbi:MutS-related protein [Mucilaginibacter kameinonensis]|uniref:MutS-related protein n=1 Tax=Mucilaginibacter kameinonensis TaxID=452286 RepID=UPI000EF7B3A0|nr:DNA mismatch repair protein [Mucilaginibacter kameinonensis]